MRSIPGSSTAAYRIVITADGGYRRGKPSTLKPAVDEALKYGCDVRMSGGPADQAGRPMEEGRDLWWHEFVGKQSEEHECEYFPAEHRSM